MITVYATVGSAVEPLRHDAYHYIPKPYKFDLVRQLVREALLKPMLYLENQKLNQTLAEIKIKGQLLIVWSSGPMRKVIKLINQMAPTDSTVLIIGETGTNKEWRPGLFTINAHSGTGSSWYPTVVLLLKNFWQTNLLGARRRSLPARLPKSQA